MEFRTNAKYEALKKMAISSLNETDKKNKATDKKQKF